MATIPGGLVGGFVATIVMTAFMMALGDDSPPPTALFWSTYVGNGPPDDYTMQGMILHLVAECVRRRRERQSLLGERDARGVDRHPRSLVRPRVRADQLSEPSGAAGEGDGPGRGQQAASRGGTHGGDRRERAGLTL